MVLEITTLKGEEMSIIGVFGLVAHHSKAMLLQMDLLTVNLEPKLFQSGKLSARP